MHNAKHLCSRVQKLSVANANILKKTLKIYIIQTEGINTETSIK